MKRLSVIAALLLAACSPSPAPPATDDVKLAARAVCRPQFTIDGKRLAAGTGFPLQLDGRVVLVTAHHLFGPGGGLPRQIEPADLPRRVSGAACAPFGDQAPWTAGPAIPVPGAQAMGVPVRYRDVAVFALDRTHPGDARALRLASENPRKGDTVWLVAQAGPGARGGQLLHPARVNVVTSGVLAVVFEDREIDLQGAGGAPFVNATGEVVGTHVAAGELRATRQVTSYAHSLDALRQALAAAKLLRP